MPVICALLTSKSPSDVILAIQFVINCKYLKEEPWWMDVDLSPH